MSNLCFSDKGMSKGFSAIEGLIALAILSIIFVATFSSFSTIRSSAKRVSNNNICENHLKKIFSKIEDQKLDSTVVQDFLSPVYPPKYSTASVSFGSSLVTAPTLASLTSDAALKARLSGAGIPADGLYKTRGSHPIDTLTIENNGVTSYMPLLANNRMGYLADLYNNGYHAADGFKALPQGLQPDFEDTVNNLNQGSFNKRYKTISKIKLELYDVKNQSPVGDMPFFFPMPSSQYPEKEGSQVTKYYPNSKNEIVLAQFPNWMREDRGIRVTLNSEIRDASSNELIQNCENFTNFEYQKKIQNTIDYGDFAAIRYAGGGASGAIFNVESVKQSTFESSNKNAVLTPANSDQPVLAPLFTNYNAAHPELGRDRDLCSQKNQPIGDVTIKFKINRINKEPGSIPLCIDTSVQWLSSEAGQGWCPTGATPFAAQSYVKINYNWQSKSGGWVPCESLMFCHQPPDRVDVIHGSDDSLEYQYHYDIRADNNESTNTRLWGCELKYMAATVDVAGNLSYPPAAKAVFPTPQTTADISSLVSKLNTEKITEINPKIYFKPPPCYLCSCKLCGSGKGGFFGSLFSFVLFIVLVVATGGLGAAALITAGATTAIISTLTLLCAYGSLGCGSSGGSTSTPFTVPSGNQFTSCSDTLNFSPKCKCGAKCTKKKVPGPRWIDSLETPDTTIAAAKLTANSCSYLSAPRLLSGSISKSVIITLSYKSKIPATMTSALLPGQYVKVPNQYAADTFYQVYDFKDDGITPEYKIIPNQEEVVWQEFDRATGDYCISTQKCNNGNWEPSKQPWSYKDPPGTLHYGNTALEGCFKVKTGFSIDWNNNGTDPNTNLKPIRKSPVCLAVDFPSGVFNETPELLKGYDDLEFECADVAGAGSTFPVLTSLPGNKRIVGSKYLPPTCAAPTSYTDATNNDISVTLGAPDPIGDGASCSSYGSGGARLDYLNQLKMKSKYKKIGYIYQLLISQSSALLTGCESFKCWAQCRPPMNMPRGPLSGEEQLYYETYIPSAHQNLEFCNGMKQADLDSIK